MMEYLLRAIEGFYLYEQIVEVFLFLAQSQSHCEQVLELGYKIVKQEDDFSKHLTVSRDPFFNLQLIGHCLSPEAVL